MQVCVEQLAWEQSNRWAWHVYKEILRVLTTRRGEVRLSSGDRYITYEFELLGWGEQWSGLCRVRAVDCSDSLYNPNVIDITLVPRFESARTWYDEGCFNAEIVVSDANDPNTRVMLLYVKEVYPPLPRD